jgi:hypothetical protein
MVLEIRQSKAMVEAVQFLLASDPRVRCTPYPLYPFTPSSPCPYFCEYHR